MPTGYTAYIEDGEVTKGKDFLKICARAFGVAMDLRDEPLDVPLPDKFEESTYYTEKIKLAKCELEQTKKLTHEEIQKIIDDEYNSNQENCKKQIEKCRQVFERYKSVLSDVESWIPPTDEHFGVKKFAIEQINMCMSDSSISYYEKAMNKKKPTIKEWLNNKIESINDNIKYYEKADKEEHERTVSKNLWLKQFRDSLV